MQDATSFQEFAKDLVLFCHVTSHVPGEPYGDLLSQKGGRGFPYLVMMDADGNVLAKGGHPRTVAMFEQMRAEARAKQTGK